MKSYKYSKAIFACVMWMG